MAQNYVWYASYGSNTLENRFLCYIKGGRPKGALRINKGCTDPTLPIDSKSINIHHEVYFAHESKSWNNGGVAFLKSEHNPKTKTLGKMYKITENQFHEVVEQENRNLKLNIDLDAVIQKQSLIVDDSLWYGKIVHLGHHHDCPIFTFTAPKTVLNNFNAPSAEYLSTIAAGIKTTYELTDNELLQYFLSLDGIKDKLTATQIKKML